jgi:hypothetical protein
VQITAGALVLAGIIAGVLVSLHGRAERAKLDREVLAVQSYSRRFDARLPKDSQLVPPDLFVIFPSVGDDLNKLREGKLDRKTLVQHARRTRSEARRSAGAIEGLQVERLIPAEFPSDRSLLQDSQFLVAQALHVYERIGDLLLSATGLPRDAQKEITGQAEKLSSLSGSLFDRGLRKLSNLGKRLGIQTVPSRTARATGTGR